MKFFSEIASSLSTKSSNLGIKEEATPFILTHLIWEERKPNSLVTPSFSVVLRLAKLVKSNLDSLMTFLENERLRSITGNEV